MNDPSVLEVWDALNRHGALEEHFEVPVVLRDRTVHFEHCPRARSGEDRLGRVEDLLGRYRDKLCGDCMTTPALTMQIQGPHLEHRVDDAVALLQAEDLAEQVMRLSQEFSALDGTDTDHVVRLVGRTEVLGELDEVLSGSEVRIGSSDPLAVWTEEVFRRTDTAVRGLQAALEPLTDHLEELAIRHVLADLEELRGAGIADPMFLRTSDEVEDLIGRQSDQYVLLQGSRVHHTWAHQLALVLGTFGVWISLDEGDDVVEARRPSALLGACLALAGWEGAHARVTPGAARLIAARLRPDTVVAFAESSEEDTDVVLETAVTLCWDSMGFSEAIEAARAL